MTIDINTGMPEVPEGYFWRVRKTSYPYGYVELRQKRRWWFSKVVASTIFRLDHMSKQSIVDDAYVALAKTNFNAPDMSLLGDYPPKKLGNN